MSLSASPIVLISDSTHGGAAIDCGRLHRGLLRQGCHSEWLTASGSEDFATHVAQSWPSLGGLSLVRLVSMLRLGRKMFDRTERYANKLSLLPHVRAKSPALINLHNIHGHLDFGFVGSLPKRVPIVWTLHDMWPLTAGCCYDYGCGAFVEGCKGECCSAGRRAVHRSPKREWQDRQNFFSRNRDRITIVTPSRWLSDLAKVRFGELLRVETIPYGLDLKEFKPAECRNSARMSLGLPAEALVVLTGADSLSDPRKGAALLQEAMELLPPDILQRIHFVTFGASENDARIRCDYTHFGRVPDNRLLNLIYGAADVFVLPTLADNLPNTLLEAMAAGTPSVVFDAGGCPEVVRDGETGFVADYSSIQSLAGAISRMMSLDDESVNTMRGRCRKVAEEEYSIDLQATRYLDLFAELHATNCGERTEG